MGPAVAIDRQDGTIRLRLSGAWRLTEDRPPVGEIAGALEPLSEVRRITFDAADLTEWDSSLLIFLDGLDDRGRAVSAGTYLVQVAAAGVRQSGKVLLLQ